MIHKKIGIIGGGAAGYFLAANLHKELGKQTILFEQAKQPLQKVRISGGGRCNVTHACFDSKELVQYYPRGERELLSVFYKFQPWDTMQWFEERNVPLKVEKDHRVFPVSNQSSSITETLINELVKNNVEARLGEGVISIEHLGNKFKLKTKLCEYTVDYLIICTGSSKKTWQLIHQLGHKIIPPVPSLFTFNTKDLLIEGLAGTSFQEVLVSIPAIGMEETGDLLITHWGFSGPAILKLSAYGAIALEKINYNFELKINFLSISFEECFNELLKYKHDFPKKAMIKKPFNGITNRFWKQLLYILEVREHFNYAELSKNDLKKIAKCLTSSNFQVEGKSTFKEEFVTAGGVDLKEIDFKTMQSKLIPNLFFAGEVLNIDAVTGGFNFQACWSEAFIIAETLNELMTK